MKCPKCGVVQSATHARCSNCGHGLAEARKAKFAQMNEGIAERPKTPKRKGRRFPKKVHDYGPALGGASVPAGAVAEAHADAVAMVCGSEPFRARVPRRLLPGPASGTSGGMVGDSSGIQQARLQEEDGESRTSLVLKVVDGRAKRDAQRQSDDADRQEDAAAPRRPFELPPAAPMLPPAPPDPPVLGPLVSERLEDFADNAQPGDQMHLPGGRVIRARDGYVAERHGGERARHSSPFDAAQHLATAVTLEPHVRKVERHVERQKATEQHRKRVEAHVRRHGVGARKAEEALFDAAKHPRARGGKFSEVLGKIDRGAREDLARRPVRTAELGTIDTRTQPHGHPAFFGTAADHPHGEGLPAAEREKLMRQMYPHLAAGRANKPSGEGDAWPGMAPKPERLSDAVMWSLARAAVTRDMESDQKQTHRELRRKFGMNPDIYKRGDLR